MKLRRTLLALFALIVGPPLTILAWLWISYRLGLAPHGVAGWIVFMLPMAVAAISALGLPIRSGCLRALTAVVCSLFIGAMTVLYTLYIACLAFGECP
jgi:hypothetical protein